MGRRLSSQEIGERIHKWTGDQFTAVHVEDVVFTLIHDAEARESFEALVRQGMALLVPDRKGR